MSHIMPIFVSKAFSHPVDKVTRKPGHEDSSSLSFKHDVRLMHLMKSQVLTRLEFSCETLCSYSMSSNGVVMEVH